MKMRSHEEVDASFPPGMSGDSVGLVHLAVGLALGVESWVIGYKHFQSIFSPGIFRFLQQTPED